MIGLAGESKTGLENGIRYLERSRDELSAEGSQETNAIEYS